MRIRWMVWALLAVAGLGLWISLARGQEKEKPKLNGWTVIQWEDSKNGVICYGARDPVGLTLPGFSCVKVR